MPRVLIFRHVPFEGPGYIQPVLEARGIDCHVCQIPDCPIPGAARASDPGEADALIFLGGPMSANDDLPGLRAEEDIIRQAVERGQPILGICLGSQLIARALGAEVHRNPAKEIGWFPLTLTEAAATDPLFAAFEPNETVFHWHSDTWDLPPGATLLASSALCPNQAYRVGDRIYGMQFHPEVTPQMIADWCCQDANCGDVRELAEPLDPHYDPARRAALANDLFARWCDLLCAAQTGTAGG